MNFASPRKTTAVPIERRRPPGRKAQLLQEASELFAAKGYPNVGVAQIAAAAGVTAPSIYRHFPDKQAILAEAVLNAIERLDQATDPELTFDEFVVEVTSVTVARPDLAVLWRWGITHLGPEWRAAIRERSTTLLARWTTLGRRLRPELTADQAELLARVMVSTISSALVRPSRISPARHARVLADIVHRIVMAQLPPNHVDEIQGAPAGASLSATEAQQTGKAQCRVNGGRREQLLEAASLLFRKRGFAAVGVDELGAAVGITGPSVYRHFPDKQAVLAAVCQRGAQHLEARVEAEFEELEGRTQTIAPSDRLHALIRAHTDALLSSPDLVVAARIGNVELTGPEGQQVREELRAHIMRWTSALLAMDESLSLAEAKVTVYAALTLANDLARARTTRERPSVRREMAVLIAAALGLD